MDVKTIEFVPSKGVNGSEDVLLCEPVSGDVQVQTLIAEYWPITDTNGGEIGIHASASAIANRIIARESQEYEHH